MLALSDFMGDLNAILIKELRQELRVRGFVWSFIGFHIVMIIFTLSVFATPGKTNEVTMATTTFFWFMLAIPLFICVPWRALSAFSKEAQAKELELIFLTRTSSRAIVFYKWLALCLQGILLLTAALPYALVNYVIGSLDILDAFTSMGLLLLLTMLLTAAALIISAQRMRNPRFSLLTIIIAIVIGLPLANKLIIFAVLGISHAVPSGLLTGPGMPVVIVAGAVFLLLLLLEFATSQIGLPEENQTTGKRIIGILALGTGLLLHAFGFGSPWVLFSAVGFFLLMILFSALLEEPVYVQSIYAPFVQGPAWKRYSGMWLYPGWPSGALYTVSMCMLLFTLMPAMPHTTLPPMHLVGIAVAAGLCLPVVLSNMLWPNHRAKDWFSIILYAVFLLGSVIGVQAVPSHTCNTLLASDYLFSLFPLSTFVLALESSRFCPVYELTGISSAIILLLLAWQWWRAWQRIRHTEALTRAALEEHPQHV